jgi:hypothetical protein
MTQQKLAALSGALAGLGYGKDCQVRLYGSVFDLLSDPICISENCVLIDARESKSGETTRIRIPMTVVQVALERCVEEP